MSRVLARTDGLCPLRKKCGVAAASEKKSGHEDKGHEDACKKMGDTSDEGSTAVSATAVKKRTADEATAEDDDDASDAEVTR